MAPTGATRIARPFRRRVMALTEVHAPLLWVRIQRRHRRPGFIDADTRLLVDGAPGSGNSYVRAWFHLANPDLPIAGFHHCGAAFTYAFRHRIPAVAMVRHPVDSVASTLARFAGDEDRDMTVVSLLESYQRVYRPVLAHLTDVVIAHFDDGDPNPWVRGIADRVNERWGLGLGRIPREEEWKVRAWVAKHTPEGQPAAVPSADRADWNRAWREEITSDRWASLLHPTLDTYERLRTLAA